MTAKRAAKRAPNVLHDVRAITPEEAEQLLQTMRNKSPMDRRLIGAYARDMRTGAWKLNGEPIVLDKNGELLSGRLRLHACVEAGTPFPTLVIEGVDPSSYETIDAIRRRTTGDIMFIRREKYGRALAAALLVLWRLLNDDLHKMSKKVSSQTLVELLESNPGLRNSIDETAALSPMLPHGMGAALHYAFSSVSPRLANTFFAALNPESGATTGPAALLRRQLQHGLEQGGLRSQVQIAGVVIRAWEHHKAGTHLALLKFSPERDNFPEITGLDRDQFVEGITARRVKMRVSRTAETGAQALDVSIETITPATALEILKKNDKNRHIADAVVQKYKRDMEAGAWMLNGQTIKIGKNGRLLDGQHRLTACIQSRKAFPAIVVRGLDENVFDTFDLGIRRPISNILLDRGESNAALLGGALRQIWLMERNLTSVRTIVPTVNELIATLERHPGIRDSVRIVNRIDDIAPPSQLVAVHYWGAKHSRTKANEFIDRLGSGAMLEGDSPILKVREALRKDRENRKVRLPHLERLALIIKGWNAFVSKKPVRTLMWRQAGEQREAFPHLLGLELIDAA